MSTATMPANQRPPLPLRTRLGIFVRLLAIQGAWNYETLLGNGIGFCIEPALRLLPGGRHTPEFHAALARESRYFNAHPYLASVAVGALARAELDGVPAPMIERFRTALGGPLGSVGDRLVWASWLPLCSLIALGTFGLGARPLLVIAIFLGIYNIGHFALRAWGLRVGFKRGLRVADALAHPVLRKGPQVVGTLAALLAGVSIPLAAREVIGGGRNLSALIILLAMTGGLFLARLGGRVEGWRISLIVLALFVLFSVIR
jgi:PTS system mannose-specific IID component